MRRHDGVTAIFILGLAVGNNQKREPNKTAKVNQKQTINVMQFYT